MPLRLPMDKARQRTCMPQGTAAMASSTLSQNNTL